MAIASLILGILGIALTCVVVGIIPSVIGLILGIMALMKNKGKKGVAIAGTVVSGIGIALFAFIMIMFFQSDSFKDSVEEGYIEAQQDIKKTEENNSFQEDWITETIENANYKIPKSWKTNCRMDNGTITYYSDGIMLIVDEEDTDISSLSNFDDKDKVEFYNGLSNTFSSGFEGYSETSHEFEEINGITSCKIKASFDGKEYKFLDIIYFVENKKAYSFSFARAEDEKYLKEIDAVIESVVLEKTQLENESEKDEKDKLNIEEKKIYNDNGISIIAKSIENNSFSTNFVFIIENESDIDYSISAHSYDVNGVMIGTNLYGFGSVDVPSKKKAKLFIELDNLEMERLGINEIYELNVIFWAYADNFKQWNTEKLSVKTNLYNEDCSYNPLGEKIYDDDMVTVWRNEESRYTVYNKSNYNAGYTVENCSVNNWSYEITNYTYDLFDKEIHSTSYAIFDLIIDKDFLRENSIDAIENIEFDILLEDSYWDYSGLPWEYKSGKISVGEKMED